MCSSDLGASADPAGWKALRGSMGSAFRLPVARATLETTLAAARSAGAKIYAAAADGIAVDKCDLRGPTLLLLGSEGQGLPDSAIEESNERIAIPMRGPINSLHVAVTAALLLYEARRQRA